MTSTHQLATRNATATSTTDVPATSTRTGSPDVVVGPIRRRTIDSVLIAAGTVVALVLVVAGGLLTWGSRFADDYVGDELAAQNIFFPDAAALDEGRTDLLGFAGEQVTNGNEAEAYASYIGHHLEGIAGGAAYADLGSVERAANAALDEAVANGSPQTTIDELQANADTVTGQRNSLFKGETLRGLLLSTFAWSTIGRIAGIAAVAAFIAAAAMTVLVALGIVHRLRTTTPT